jgi:dipeptidase E
VSARRLLLLSSSTVYGSGYLDYAEAALGAHLTGVRRLLFVPYALHDRDVYAEKVRARFEPIGLAIDAIHEAADPRRAVAKAEAVFIGGGNTFRLLQSLREAGLLGAIRSRALEGMPYVGASAGTNVACPTIRTTNDMPIVELPSLEAMALVDFQINPHYRDRDPASTHMGETREERIAQYLEENALAVVGLREGAMLRVEGESVRLIGIAGARVFRRGRSPEEVAPDSLLFPNQIR